MEALKKIFKEVGIVLGIVAVIGLGIFGLMRAGSAGDHDGIGGNPTFVGDVDGYRVSYIEGFQPFYGRERNELVIREMNFPERLEAKVDLLLQDQVGWHELPVHEIDPSREYRNDTLEVVVVSTNLKGSITKTRINRKDVKPGTWEHLMLERGEKLYAELREQILVELNKKVRDSLPLAK